MQFNKTGTVLRTKKVSCGKLTEHYCTVFNHVMEILNCGKYAVRSIEIYGAHTKAHFIWLAANGYSRIEKVTAETIRDYLVINSQKYSAQTLVSMKSSIRKIYGIMRELAITQSDFDAIFTFRIVTEKKIHPAPPPEDIAKALSQIDRTTYRGKRDFAIILLGVVTGMRSCDIARLKLRDIDWQSGEIHFYQPKTHKHSAFPLTKDIAVALEDYILNGRHVPSRKVDDSIEEIFLRNRRKINLPQWRTKGSERRFFSCTMSTLIIDDS